LAMPAAAAQITYLIVESYNSSATCPGSKSSAFKQVTCKGERAAAAAAGFFAAQIARD